MTRVKKFKELGVVFVEGDSTSTKSGSVQFNSLDKDGVAYMNYERNNKPDDYIVNSFAWRPYSTLPVNPKFKFEYNDGSIRAQWRPLLDQPKKSVYDVDAHVSGEKVKPVFTQEMVEFKAGDFVSVLPPKGVGQSEAKFLLVGFDLMGNAIIQHCCSKHISDTRKSRLIAPIDNRTDKQKAVDAACESINQAHNTIVINIVSELYDNGFIK